VARLYVQVEKLWLSKIHLIDSFLKLLDDTFFTKNQRLANSPKNDKSNPNEKRMNVKRSGTIHGAGFRLPCRNDELFATITASIIISYV
jgi:hypothetical protein